MTHPTQRGFTILEMTVVLAIVAVLLAMGIDLGRNATNGADRLAVRERLAVIKAAIDEYADRNGYYPCPANPAVVSGGTNWGLESRSTTAGAGCTISGGVTLADDSIQGMLPHRTLGLSETYASDPWGNKFTYAVSYQHVGMAIFGQQPLRNSDGTLAIFSGVYGGTNYRLSQTSKGLPSIGAGYVVISHGPDARGAYALQSITTPVSCPAGAYAENGNCDRSNISYWDNPYNEGDIAETRFEDYVVWGGTNKYNNPVSNPAGPGSCSSSCESWCAPCSTNIGASNQLYLCTKFVTQFNPCNATCIWSDDTTPCP